MRCATAMLVGCTIAAGSSCAPSDQHPPAADSLANTRAAITTATTGSTRSVASTTTAVPAAFPPDTAPPLLRGFHQIGIIQTSSVMSDTIIRQRMLRPSGWVYAPQESWSSDPAVPELVVRADSSPSAPMVAYVKFWMMHDGGWDTIYAVRDSSLHGEMDCVTYEVLGMPTAQLIGSWAHVIYGYTSSGDARLGWVKLVPGKVVFTDEQTPLDE